MRDTLDKGPMFSDACTPFVNAIRQARLLSDAQLTELSRSPDVFHDARDLALDLVRRGLLTPFQVERLARGRGSELVLGRYILLERIGEGGMGQVFKARHLVMDRLVALKIIRPDLLHHASAVRRFHQEIRAVAQLSHPNIVIAHDADQEGDTHFLVMEYVRGVDLKQLVKTGGKLGVGQACDYIRQAALGLQHAHERGMVHRDLKPGNLLLTLPRREPHGTLVAPTGLASEPGCIIKILDLGLALLQSADVQKGASSAATQTGALIGTPDYMAPEQANDARRVDIRADLYSLGCTLFYLITARAPFEDGSLLEKLYKHKYEPPPPITSLRPDVPAEVAAIVHKLIAKEPQDRYQTPAEVVHALTPFCQGNVPVEWHTQSAHEASGSRRSASTFGSGTDRPDTMSAPDIAEADAALASTSGAWESLQRALDALSGGKGGTSDTTRLPGMSSISDFMPLDSRLGQSLTPALPLPRKHRGRNLALVLGGVAVAALAGISMWLGLASRNLSEKSPEMAFAPKQPELRKRIGEGGQEEQEQKEAAARKGEAAPPTKLGEPGSAKPLVPAAGAESASNKPDTDADTPGLAKPWTGVESLVWKVPQDRPLESASFTPDAQRVHIQSEDTVSVYDLRDVQAGPKSAGFFPYDFQLLQGAKPVLRTALAPQGDRVLIATIDSVQKRGQLPPPAPMLGYYKPSAIRPMQRFATGGPAITCVCGCPSDAPQALTGDQQGTVSLWQFGEELRRRYVWMGRHKSVVECLAVSRDGSRALSGDRGGKLWVWDLKKGEPLRELVGAAAPINAVALSFDGGVAASADESGVRLWNVTNGRELRQIPPPLARGVQCLVFSLDATHLLAGKADGTVCMCNAEAGTLTREWNGHSATVLAVAFAAEGDAIYSVAKDNTIRRWDLSPTGGSFRASAIANGSEARPAAIKD
jgi:serine/threonine-protein kinase